ncbi:hypothetical protein FHW36_108133 [Chitinophaga polysaccharea]|uniref:Uncharacterized protein n=1 Tax=Chitinophaga polysaccharea TaxID=1293035 RepID=A0A561PCC6_9BACT|nr:hypothetical protein FHW36_108133 [Chitinophaga polysaccharea]
MVRYEFDRCIYYVSLFRMRIEAEKKREELVQLILKQCIIYMSDAPRKKFQSNNTLIGF